MLRLQIPLLTIVLCIFLCQRKESYVEASSPVGYPHTTHFIDKEIQRMMRKHHLPALAITLVDDQEIIYQAANGLIDIKNNVHASTGSVFKLYSIAKVFTALEIFREVEEGFIELDGSISEYLPEFSIQSRTNDKDSITIKSLLAHRSGLPRNECVLPLDADNDSTTLDKFESATSGCFLAYPAGYRYKYSNLGYDLLGRIIEQTRGEGYSSFMKAHLLNDLEMENSTFTSGDITDSETLAKGYEFYKGDYYPMGQSDINSVPSGNLYSTITDLSIFITSVIGNEVFKKKETLSRMFDDHYSEREDPETMGLGWKTTKIRGSELMIWHDGGPIEGIGSLVAILPGKKNGIAIIGNGTSFSGNLSVPFAIDVINHLLDEKSKPEYTPSVKHGRGKVNSELLTGYAGKYITFGMVMNVSAKRNKLKGRIGGIGLDLIPVTETEFSVTHWMDKTGLTKIFMPPIEFDKIKIEFHTSGSKGASSLIINLDNISFEICPKYPGHVNIPDNWDDLEGEYRMAERLSNNEPGAFVEYYASINMEDDVLNMSGVFGPILPVDDQYLIIVSGPFAGETLEYCAESGNLIHQNAVFVPINRD